jgi:MFS family permease
MAGFDRDQVARGLFALAAAQIVGYPLAGALADRLRRMGVKTVTTSVSGMMLFAGVQVVMLSGISPWVTPVWIAFGFVVSTSSLSYAALCQNFPPELAGRVNTSANLIYFSCAFAAQAGMGAIIDLWPPGPAGGYATEGYQAAFGTMLAIQVLAIAWFFAAPRIWPASRGE